MGLICAGSSFAEQSCDNVEQFKEISHEQLVNHIADRSAVIIDVNSEGSFQEHHVTGAIHYGTEKDHFAQVLPKNKKMRVIAYCGGPKCTAWQKAAKAACELGYTNIRHYKPGIKGWIASQK